MLRINEKRSSWDGGGISETGYANFLLVLPLWVKSFLACPPSKLAMEDRLGVGEVLLLILFFSSGAFANIDAAIADSLPLLTLLQGTLLKNLEDSGQQDA